MQRLYIGSTGSSSPSLKRCFSDRVTTKRLEDSLRIPHASHLRRMRGTVRELTLPLTATRERVYTGNRIFSVCTGKMPGDETSIKREVFRQTTAKN